MTNLPIPADSMDFLFSNKVPSELRLLTYEEGALCDSLLPDFPVKAWQNLNAAIPYMVAYYQTPGGWLCTTRRAYPANEKVPGIVARELVPATCWAAETPASALLAMIAARLGNGEFGYSRRNTELTVKAACAA